MLKIRNLYKIFHKDTINEKVAFDNLNLEINKGDFVTIIGSNGAGKSTLLNIISGNLKVDEGNIFLKDNDISKLPEFKRSKSIGRVFQNPTMGTSPSMTILENLAMAYNKGKKFNLSMGISKKYIPDFINILKSLSLGLENQINTKVGLLSGGQRQALSLIMATMASPQVLLLDEHTAALDPKTAQKIIHLTEKVVLEKNITTLMVTHNLKDAINMGNRLIMLHNGKIILDIKGKEKKELTIEQLMKCFEKTQSSNLLSDKSIFC